MAIWTRTTSGASSRACNIFSLCFCRVKVWHPVGFGLVSSVVFFTASFLVTLPQRRAGRKSNTSRGFGLV